LSQIALDTPRPRSRAPARTPERRTSSSVIPRWPAATATSSATAASAEAVGRLEVGEARDRQQRCVELLGIQRDGQRGLGRDHRVQVLTSTSGRSRTPRHTQLGEGRVELLARAPPAIAIAPATPLVRWRPPRTRQLRDRTASGTSSPARARAALAATARTRAPSRVRTPLEATRADVRARARARCPTMPRGRPPEIVESPIAPVVSQGDRDGPAARGQSIRPALAELLCDERRDLRGRRRRQHWDAVIAAEPALAVTLDPESSTQRAGDRGLRRLKRPTAALRGGRRARAVAAAISG